jgi:hypothetical protein
MITFKAIQHKLLPSTPQSFTFSSPPMMGWWGAEFGLSQAAALFVHHYQSILGKNTYARDGVFWQVEPIDRWQAAAFIAASQWRGVKSELDESAAHLLTFSVHMFKGKKATWIRPSDQLLAVFGMTLENYDAIAALDFRVSRQLSPYKGPAIPDLQPLSHDEADALALWVSRGGLSRLQNAAFLGKELGSCNVLHA